ncbi:MAG: PrsW family glutamic-type intramembrane protease [Rectinemataceae bacterium]|jgi:RsiW-degrading membrane proteinase PrsW (M82 family)
MSSLSLSLFLAGLPAFIILLYIRHLDRARPEPIGLIGRSVLYGFLAVMPAAAIEFGIGLVAPERSTVSSHLFYAFAVAGLIEESVKLYFIRRYLFRRREFDERADGIVYAICVSMGFAFVENLLYGYRDTGVLLVRAISAVPGHALFSGIMGYYIGLSKIEADRRGAWIRGLVWAVVLHGLYDFLLFSGLGLVVIPLLVAGSLVLVRLFRKSARADAADRIA